MEPNKLDNQRIEHAREQVKKLKNFYIHLFIYVIVNLINVFKNIQELGPDESYFQVHNFITLGTWGIVIIIHALSVFIPNFVFGSKWEERKIKKFMQQEEKHQQWD